MNRRAGVAAFALLIALIIGACGGDDKLQREEFKLNPGEFYCHGYKETSPGDALLLPGDHYWHGTTSVDCPII